MIKNPRGLIYRGGGGGGGGGRVYGGAYIRDVNWVTYLGSVYSGSLYTGGVNRILRSLKTTKIQIFGKNGRKIKISLNLFAH